MIPEFKALITRDKGSKGDYRGDLKLKATAEFSYIFLMLDWKTPFRNYDIVDRKREALRCTGLTEKDVSDDTFLEAYRKYEELLYNASRALRTLDKMASSLDKLDQYFEELDFTERDKQGKIVYSVEDYLNNIQKAEKAYESIARFQKTVFEELENAGSIQGSRKLGIRERQFSFENKKRDWSEGSARPASEDVEDNEQDDNTNTFDPVEL